MDPNRFDALMRSLRQPRTRRGAVAALLAGVLGPVVPAAEGKRGRARRRAGTGKVNGKARGQGKGRQNARAAAIPANCCSSGNCTPGKGKNLAKCCYDGNVSDKNFSGANLGSANFSGANATGANFSGANAGKACFVDADLTDARITSGTNLGGAVFCRTVMPDDSINNSGCTKGTTCCPTCIRDGHACGTGITGSCCAGTECLGGVCGSCDVCPSGCPFDNLEDAVDAASAGDTIRICPGTYRTVNVDIGENLTIVGAGDGAGGTILDGDLQDRVLEINAPESAETR